MAKQPRKASSSKAKGRSTRASDAVSTGAPVTKDDNSVLSDLAQHALQPAAAAFGGEFTNAGRILGQTAAGIVEVATAPFRAVIWGYRQVEDRLIPRIVEKISKIPEEKRINPDKSIVGLALEGSKFSLHDESLTEMFANLVASSANLDVSYRTHPAFVSIIQGLSPIDARALQYFSGKYVSGFGDSPSNFPVVNFWIRDKRRMKRIYMRHVSELIFFDEKLGAYGSARCLDNFERLGIVRLQYGNPLAGWGSTSERLDVERNPYATIMKHERVVFFANKITDEGHVFEAEPGFGMFTQFGRDFLKSVLV